jgi:PAS domain S-box-containing protein
MTINKGIYASIFDDAIQAIILVDQRGIIRDLNPATTEIFGYAKHELLGQNVSVLMPSPYREAHDGYIEHYLATGDALAGEVSIGTFRHRSFWQRERRLLCSRQ